MSCPPFMSAPLARSINRRCHGEFDTNTSFIVRTTTHRSLPAPPSLASTAAALRSTPPTTQTFSDTISESNLSTAITHTFDRSHLLNLLDASVWGTSSLTNSLTPRITFVSMLVSQPSPPLKFLPKSTSDASIFDLGISQFMNRINSRLPLLAFKHF